MCVDLIFIMPDLSSTKAGTYDVGTCVGAGLCGAIMGADWANTAAKKTQRAVGEGIVGSLAGVFAGAAAGAAGLLTGAAVGALVCKEATQSPPVQRQAGRELRQEVMKKEPQADEIESNLNSVQCSNTSSCSCFKAKFRQKCRACGNFIRKGDCICNDGGGWLHVRCGGDQPLSTSGTPKSHCLAHSASGRKASAVLVPTGLRAVGLSDEEQKLLTQFGFYFYGNYNAGKPGRQVLVNCMDECISYAMFQITQAGERATVPSPPILGKTNVSQALVDEGCDYQLLPVNVELSQTAADGGISNHNLVYYVLQVEGTVHYFAESISQRPSYFRHRIATRVEISTNEEDGSPVYSFYIAFLELTVLYHGQ
mmetsp:Transcript_21528/g.59746  ORF Transcript_21528/g.59746 Transcript_21528/m.59746 type:complete len:367 (+) Transcript_21528:1608-2708(+)